MEAILTVVSSGSLNLLPSVKFMDLNLLRVASLVAQLVKNLPAMPETWVRSLYWENPLEKRMATHSSSLIWRIPWTV